VTTCHATVTFSAAPSMRDSSRLAVVVVQGAAAEPSVARIFHCSSRLLLLFTLRTDVSTKLLVQSTELIAGVWVSPAPLVPLSVVVPRWTDTPASNSTT
jgi:hypothetical protein